jgi:hypothetical protein
MPCLSPYNSPILPVLKLNNKYNLLQNIKKPVIAIYHIVPSPCYILDEISWYNVNNFKNRLCYFTLGPKHQLYFI